MVGVAQGGSGGCDFGVGHSESIVAGVAADKAPRSII